jgi:hypothetical protein
VTRRFSATGDGTLYCAYLGGGCGNAGRRPERRPRAGMRWPPACPERLVSALPTYNG